MLKPSWVLPFAIFLVGAVPANGAYCADGDWSLDNELIDAPKPVSVPDLRQPAGAGNNTCQYAFNDVCDEPSNCAAGTDSHDCTLGLGH
jgi:hypothetical protein